MLEEVAHDISELKYDVCDFIVEIRKENGQEYPSSSLYDLLGGLSLYLQREKNFNDKLMSTTFKEIRNTLDNVMKEHTSAGIKGCPVCDVVTENHEQILWEKGILGRAAQTNSGGQSSFFVAYGLDFMVVKNIQNYHIIQTVRLTLFR